MVKEINVSEALNALRKEREEETKKKENVNNWGYLLHHYFPHYFKPKRFPDFLSFPTHVMGIKSEFIVPVGSDGKMAMYWNPATVVNLNASVAMSSNAAECQFAHSGTGATGTAVLASGTGIFQNPVYFDYSYAGFTSRSSFHRVRLLSAYMEIQYIGKPLDASGLLRVGMFPLQFNTGLSTAALTPAGLQNCPIYGSFPADEKVVIFFRHMDDNTFQLGPYDTTSTRFPVTVIWGESLQATGSFKVTINRVFEGIVAANMAQFLSPIKEEVTKVSASAIKSKYGAFDVKPIMKQEDYEKIYHDLFGQHHVFHDYTDEESKALNHLYKYMKDISRFEAGFINSPSASEKSDLAIAALKKEFKNKLTIPFVSLNPEESGKLLDGLKSLGSYVVDQAIDVIAASLENNQFATVSDVLTNVNQTKSLTPNVVEKASEFFSKNDSLQAQNKLEKQKAKMSVFLRAAKNVNKDEGFGAVMQFSGKVLEEELKKHITNGADYIINATEAAVLYK